MRRAGVEDSVPGTKMITVVVIVMVTLMVMVILMLKVASSCFARAASAAERGPSTQLRLRTKGEFCKQRLKSGRDSDYKSQVARLPHKRLTKGKFRAC